MEMDAPTDVAPLGATVELAPTEIDLMDVAVHPDSNPMEVVEVDVPIEPTPTDSAPMGADVPTVCAPRAEPAPPNSASVGNGAAVELAPTTLENQTTIQP